MRESAAACAGTSGNGNSQRRCQPIGDRGATRVSHLGGKSLQLVDENLMPLFDRVFRQLDPYQHRPIVTETRMVAAQVRRSNGDICAARMRATRYQPKATVGYQSGPREATSPIHR
jgi:hypothetical protein